MRNKKIISLVPRLEILRKSEIKIWVKIRIIQFHRTHVNYKSKTIFINESGLYALILSSKLPQAREFKRRVASEVLGQIRKMGGYILINDYDLVLWFICSFELLNRR